MRTLRAAGLAFIATLMCWPAAATAKTGDGTVFYSGVKGQGVEQAAGLAEWRLIDKSAKKEYDGGSLDKCPNSLYGFRPGERPFAGRIVKWNAEKPRSVTSWLVSSSGQRRWIPDGGTLTTDGAGGAFTESQCYSADGPEHWAIADGVASNRARWGGGTAPPTPTPVAPPRTWAEQQGSRGANTFTNPYNASGMGVKIAPYQWVEVSCKVYAPQIASANPDGCWSGHP
jgi:hypothetical protein